MRWLGLLALLFVACAEPRPQPRASRAKSPIHRVAGRAARSVSLSLTDALGGAVRLGAGQERVAVVVFMSRSSGDESKKFLRALDEKLLNGPVDSIGVVDLERYGGLWRSIAERRLRSALVEGRAARKERRLACGADASPSFVDRWHLIGDFDGAVLGAFGVDREPPHPVAYVVDRSGALSGPYSELGALVDAAQRSASASRSGRDSRLSRRARTLR